MERPSLHQLALLLAAVEHGTLTAAAEATTISQPAISMQLKALERHYGTPLMERVGRRVQPTPAGKIVAEYAARVLALVDDLGRVVEDVRELRAGQLLLGASATIGETLLPEVLGRFRTAHPGVELVLRIGNSRQIVEAVRHYTLGLGIVGGVPEDPELEALPVVDDTLAVFVAANSPLLARAPLSMTELAGETVVLREPGSATRDLAVACLARRGVTPAATLEFGSNEAVKRAVAAGLGVGILSQHTLGVDLRAGDIALLPCAGWECRRQFQLIRRRERPLTRAERAFLALLAEGPATEAKPNDHAART